MATIVHFDIPADDLERAQEFYKDMFDWKIEAPPGFPDYYLIETKGLSGTPGVGGGLGKREAAGQQILTYFDVASIEDAAAKVESLGGKVIQPKVPVPGWGYLAVCLDTEQNTFGLWQEDASAH